MLNRAASSSGEILRPTENLIMPDSYIQTCSQWLLLLSKLISLFYILSAEFSISFYLVEQEM